MNSLRNIVDSVLGFWNDATPVSRVGLILLVLFGVAGIGFVGYWSSTPSYVTLVSDGDLEKISRVVDELDKNGIRYELAGAGGVLRVDQRNLARARMLADSVGLATDQQDATGSMGGMWLDPTERKTLEVRKKERMLEATINSYAVVESTDVHLNVPIKGPFERRVASPSASVLVSLRPGQNLTDENVLAIASTIAFAVEQLELESIRITDEAGNVYQVPNSSSVRVDSQMDYTAQQERSLSFKAQQQLARFFGFGNASVQISMDYTFIESSEESTQYDPDGRVAENENIKTESTTSDDSASQGPAGVASNLTAQGNGGQSEVLQKKEELVNSFLVPKTTTSQVNNTPKKNYMTVSVLVNNQAPGVLADDGTVLPDIKARVEDLVKSAVGFSQDTDQIAVDFAAFPVIEDDIDVAAPFDWDQLNEVLRNVSLAIAALVVFGLGFLTLRAFNSRSVGGVVAGQTMSQTDRLAQISDLARNNPEVFASVVKAWAGNEALTADDSEPVDNQKAA